MKRRRQIARDKTIMLAIERTQQRIRLMEINGRAQEVIDGERRLLIRMRATLSWSK